MISMSSREMRLLALAALVGFGYAPIEGGMDALSNGVVRSGVAHCMEAAVSAAGVPRCQSPNAFSTSGLATATNYAVEPYLTYAPQAPKGSQVGGGVFVASFVAGLLSYATGGHVEHHDAQRTQALVHAAERPRSFRIFQVIRMRNMLAGIGPRRTDENA